MIPIHRFKHFHASWMSRIFLAGFVLVLALAFIPVITALTQSGSIECLSLTMSPATMKDGSMGASYSQTFTTTQNWGCCAIPPYVYSVYSGGLPAGLTLSSSGTVTGTPIRPGSYTFGLKSEDSGSKPNGYHCEGIVTVTITGTNIAPTFSAGPDVTVLEDAPAYSAVWATNISVGGPAEIGQTLTFHVTNDNNGLFSVQPAIRTTDGVLSFTLKANANGVAIVDAYLQDNGGTANGGSDTSQHALFKIMVTAVDDVQVGPTYSVNSTAWTTDGACTEGSCTLREAIQAANTDGVDSTIELVSGTVYEIQGVDNTASSIAPTEGPNGLPRIQTPIVINGHGASITRNDAAPNARLFYVDVLGRLILNEVQLQKGELNSTIYTGDTQCAGGAILNWGELIIKNSYLAYNDAWYGSAIQNEGTASIYNSTFYANSAHDSAINSFGSLNLYSSTFINNLGVTQSSISLGWTSNTMYNFYNNLFASSGSSVPLCHLTVPSNIIKVGGNLATDSSCTGFGITTYTAVKPVTPPDLNGGSTKNMAIQAGSSAIDTGQANACADANINGRDQRRYNRVADGNGDGTAVCDAGSYEYNSTALPPTSEHDTTPPVVTIEITPALPDGANGWYRSAVAVNPQASDDSGVKQLRCMLDPAIPPTTFNDLPDEPCPRPGGGIVMADGEHTVYAAAQDIWNNASVPISISFKIDATAPSITCPWAGPFLLGSGDQAVGPIGVDASVSGLDDATSTLSGIVPTDSVGPKTLIFKAVDLAGNETIDGCAYLVMYEFGGFYAPVKNPPDFNEVRAGQSVPLKFSLAGDQGLEVIVKSYPASQPVDCTTLALLGNSLATEPAGKSGLSYDRQSGWYNYIWKTDKAWAGACRVLVIQLIDGTEHLAYFRFK